MATKNASKSITLIPAPTIECPDHVSIKIGDKTPQIVSAEMNSGGNAVVLSIKVFLGASVDNGSAGCVVLPDSITIEDQEYWVNLYCPWKWSKAGKRYKDGRPSITLMPKVAKEEKKVAAQDIPF